jgi:hypothetical protein
VSSGTVISNEGDKLELKTSDGEIKNFKLTPKTELKGKIKPGKQAKVFYNVSVNENLPGVATVVTIDSSTDELVDKRKEKKQPR